MATWDAIAQLPVSIDGYSLSGLEQPMGPEFIRACTLIDLHGGGEHGVGEDVVYDQLDHIAFQDAGQVLDLTGPATLGELSELIDGLDLFPDSPPVREPSRNYRRWAFESAALDLALRQAGKALGEVVGRTPRPLNYVVSMRLTAPAEGEPETAERLTSLLERYPGTRFKLDPTNTWTDELMAELAATGAVDSVDLKGHYKGTPVDVVTDADMYRRVAEAFPDAWIEDPDLDDPEAAKALEGEHDRITWDAPIHSVADIEALAFPPKTVNVKPSRLGGLESLCAAYDYCERARDRRLRRRPDRAGRRPRPHPVPGRHVPSRHPQRHRPAGLQPGPGARRAAVQPAGGARGRHRLPIPRGSRHVIKEFRDFILRGNLVDLAVAFVIGAAFAALVTSLVSNIFTPLIAAIVGEPSFAGLKFEINGSVFTYGRFLNALISFLSIAAVVFFFVVKPYNALLGRFTKAKEDDPQPDVVLLEEIRDLLKQQGSR